MAVYVDRAFRLLARYVMKVFRCPPELNAVSAFLKTHGSGGWWRCHIQRLWGWHCEVEADWLLYWLSQLHSYPKKWHPEHAAVLYTRGRPGRTGERYKSIKRLLCFFYYAYFTYSDHDFHYSHDYVYLISKVEDEVDEINAKVFTELEKKLQDS